MSLPGPSRPSISIRGVQSFSERFGRPRRTHHDGPHIAFWRCNLTGLSQTRNLLFIGYGEHIYVYIPQFPTQALPKHPALVFSSQPSAPNLPGYINPRVPHCINYLLVQKLGEEEVVAVVRDDGDVDAFLVRHIDQAISRRSEPGNDLGILANELRPFFQDNVGHSAWGLAIHTEARILATSSNAHEIRIFTFGLARKDSSSSSESDIDLESDTSGEESHASHRDMDVTYHVLNGETNIPYIAFCNTGDDPTARWLLTTDIGGTCRLIDLHSVLEKRYKEPARMFRFGNMATDRDWDDFDRHNAGWIISFLDKRAFRPEETVEEALGLQDAEIAAIKKARKVWDITRVAAAIASPDAVVDRVARLDGNIHQPADNMLFSTRSTVIQNPDTSDAGEDRFSDQDDSQDEDGGVSLLTSFNDEDLAIDQVSEGSSSVVEPIHDSTTLLYTDAEDFPNVEPAVEFPSPDHHDGTGNDTPSVPISDHDSVYHEDETGLGFNATSPYNGYTVYWNRPRCVGDLSNPINDLPCPILHTSSRNAYLIQPYGRKGGGEGTLPMVGFARPLDQDRTDSYDSLEHFERLNMYAEIPALGLVVVASQKGRAMILALTKLCTDASYPPELQMYSDSTTYAMRLECVLPFREQENARQRPEMPLHGIAVSPLQGCKDSRWRLMMIYQDHTVLSYEIARPNPAKDSPLDIERLIA